MTMNNGLQVSQSDLKSAKLANRKRYQNFGNVLERFFQTYGQLLFQ